MKRLLALAPILCLPNFAEAATTGSAFASGYISFQAFIEDPFTGPSEIDLVIQGREHVDASASVSGRNDIQSARDSSNLTITNTQATQVEVYYEAGAFAEASTNIEYGGPLGSTRFDSNGFVSLGIAGAFASTNGTYNCSIIKDSDPNFNCYGFSDGQYNDGYDSGVFYLDAGESRSFTLTANAFAFLESDIASVPVPAGGMMLLGGLAGLAGLRKRKAAKALC